MPKPTPDLTGRVFGRLTVIRSADKCTSHGQARWFCSCSCGGTKTVLAQSLARGNTSSCGCFRREFSSFKSTTHGHCRTGGKRRTPEYNSWRGMIERCTNPRSIGWKRYGGRGIEVCERWRNSFIAFLSDLGPRPTARHTLERSNNNRNYEPGNVSWALPPVQARNKRNNRFLVLGNERHTLSEWARRIGLKRTTLEMRLNSHGWTVERALSEPVRRRA